MLASFPDSTPQLFIALSHSQTPLPSFLSHSAINSWGVESGNEARLCNNKGRGSSQPAQEVVRNMGGPAVYTCMRKRLNDTASVFGKQASLTGWA